MDIENMNELTDFKNKHTEYTTNDDNGSNVVVNTHLKKVECFYIGDVGFGITGPSILIDKIKSQYVIPIEYIDMYASDYEYLYFSLLPDFYVFLENCKLCECIHTLIEGIIIYRGKLYTFGGEDNVRKNIAAYNEINIHNIPICRNIKLSLFFKNEFMWNTGEYNKPVSKHYVTHTKINEGTTNKMDIIKV